MQVAGLQDFRQEGPPGDTGIFQSPFAVRVFPFTFSGTTYIVAMRTGVRGWVLVTPPNTDAYTVIQTVINSFTVSGSISFQDWIYVLTTGLLVNKYIRMTSDSSGHTDTFNTGVVFKAGAAIASVIHVSCAIATSPCNGPLLENFSINGDSQASIGLLVDNETTRFVCSRVTVGYAIVWGLMDLMNHSHAYICCQFCRNGANATDPSGNVCLGDSTHTANAVDFYSCSSEWSFQYGVYVFKTNGATWNGGAIEGNYNYGYYSGMAGSLAFGVTLHGVMFEDNNGRHNAGPANYVANSGYYQNFEDCNWYESEPGTTYSLTVLGGYNTISYPHVGGGLPGFFMQNGLDGNCFIGNASLLTRVGFIRIVDTRDPNRLHSIVPAAATWGVNPADLDHSTDEDYASVTGSGSTVLGGAGAYGVLTWDMGAVYKVKIQGQIFFGTTLNTWPNFQLGIETSSDGATWVYAAPYFNTWMLNINTTISPKMLNFMAFGAHCRYIRLTWTGSAAGTWNGGVNELEAIDTTMVDGGL